jgi:uncharacterized protein
MTIIKPQSDNTALPVRHRKHVPQRTCIGCRTIQNSKQLLRLACTAHGQVVMDLTGRLPGRGGYVCYNGRCLQKALQPAKLSLIFKQSVIPPDFNEVYATIVQAIRTRLRSCLSMAQKAGAVVSGSEALHKALTQATIQCIIVAEDAVVSRAAEYHVLCAEMHVSCVCLFSKDDLGSCIGKSPRTAIGLRTKHFCDFFCGTLQLLRQLQTL